MDTKHHKVRALISSLTSPSHQTHLHALQQLHLITKQDPHTRAIITDTPSAIPSLLHFLYSPSHPLQHHASATLFNISISLKHPLISSLPAISHVLAHHASTSSPSAVQSCAATLHSLLVLDIFRPIIGSKKDILLSLVHIIDHVDSPVRSVKDALKALFGVSLHPLNRCVLVEVGAVEVLFKWVVKESVKVGVLEDVTAVIAQIAGCEESVEAFERVGGIGVMVGVLEEERKWSMKVKENVVSGLLKLVRCGGERVAVDVRVRALGAFDAIEDVKENGSDKGKAKAQALLVELMGDNGIHWNNNSTHSRFYSSSSSSSSHGSWFNFSTDSSESGV